MIRPGENGRDGRVIDKVRYRMRFVLLLVAGFAALGEAAPPFDLPVVLSRSGPLREETIAIPGLKAGAPYSLLFSVRSLRTFGAESRVRVELGPIAKTLHAGDPDLYALFRAPRDGNAS